MYASTAYCEQQPATGYLGTATGPTEYQPTQPAAYPEAGTQAAAYQQPSFNQGVAYQQGYDTASVVSAYSTYDPPAASVSFDPPAAPTAYATKTDYSSTHVSKQRRCNDTNTNSQRPRSMTGAAGVRTRHSLPNHGVRRGPAHVRSCRR
jgi:hypothetical protein